MFTATKIPTSIKSFLAENNKLFIDGDWVDAESGETIDLINPSDGTLLARAAVGGQFEIDAAVRAARRALDGPWGKMGYVGRRDLLIALSDALAAEIDELAFIDALNMGMPLQASRAIIGGLSIETLRYNAGWAGKINGKVISSSSPDQMCYTVKEPVGVVGAIVPWNSPLLGAICKLAPALAAGCTVILKPSELTPLSVIRLSRLIKSTGFPDGVVNIVNGLGSVAGQAMIDHPGIDKIAFTGSTAVGQQIVRSAAATMKRVSLELGGKSPVFIFEDADLEKAIPGACATIFRNAGQVCAAGSRIYVQRSILDKVIAGIAARAEEIVVAGALESGVDMGPVVSARQKERILDYVESGRSEGAEIVIGGCSIDRPGFFLKPTVITQTKPSMKVVQEEIFGPVVIIEPFDDDNLDTLASIGNNSEYGLAAYIWTTNVSRVHGLAAKLRAGLVMVNGGTPLDRAVPFGGFKKSGWGREYGSEGIENYLETKSITIAL